VIEIKTDAFKRALAGLRAKYEHAASIAIATGIKVAEDVAVAALRSQTKRRTGELEDGTLSYQRSSREGVLFSSAKHARFIEAGTVPHVIAARRTQFLRFVVGGKTVFRRAVFHPGTEPRPFMAPAAIAGETAMVTAIEREADRIAREF